MSFTVQLAEATYPVEPGSSAAVAVEVKNLGSQAETFELSVEGVDQHWAAVPVPSFTVEAGETVVERIFLKPPRESESTAGTYPFLVTVRSLDSGDSKVAQGTLDVKPYYHLSIDVSPRKAAVSPFRKSATFEVTVMSLGNVEQTLSLHASDIDDEFAYEFSESQITLGAGQQQTVELTTLRTKGQLVAGSKLGVVSVSARNVDSPAVSTTAQIHVEQKPLISPAPLVLFLAVVSLVLFWFFTLPKPPHVTSLSFDQNEVMVGEMVTVSWQTTDANSVELKVGDSLYSGFRPEDSFEFRASEAGEVVVQLVAVNGKNRSEPRQQTLTVTAPEQAPTPEISTFTTSKRQVSVGTTFTLNYDVNDAVTDLYLEPIGAVDVRSRSKQLQAPTEPGKITYILRATNKDGKSTSKSVEVEFVKLTQVNIAMFSANPLEVDPLDGRVKLSWQIANAVRATISFDGNEQMVEPGVGSLDIVVTKDTVITLTGYDADGLPAQKELTIKAKIPPGDPGDPASGVTTGGTTGDGTRTTGN